MHDLPLACRSCGEVGLKPIISLGSSPLANRLLTADQLDEEEPKHPLDLVLCPCCTLVQITETVPHEELFRDYSYCSSFADGMLRHAQQLATQLIRARNLNAASLVLEVASNDGYLLQYYRQAGIPVLGVEPALNIAQIAQRERSIPTLCEFFGLSLAQRLAQQGLRADVVHAHNVLAHVPDLNEFVTGLGLVVKKDGVVVIEVPYVRDLIENVEFDTIYHEHLCYFSLTALDRLFTRHGLRVVEVERLPIHGGSLRILVQKVGQASQRVQELLQDEADRRLHQLTYYHGFIRRVEQLRDELVALLRELKANRRRIAAYGASAKGTTLLNYLGVGRETLEFVVDRNPIKQGRYTPGTHLKICAPEKLTADRPDYVLLLSWNFAEEILAQQAAYREHGGRFIIPIPNVKVA